MLYPVRSCQVPLDSTCPEILLDVPLSVLKILSKMRFRISPNSYSLHRRLLSASSAVQCLHICFHMGCTVLNFPLFILFQWAPVIFHGSTKRPLTCSFICFYWASVWIYFAFVTNNLVNPDHSFGRTPHISFGTKSVPVLHAVQLCAFLSARVSK